VLLNTAVKLRAEGTPLNTEQRVAILTSASPPLPRPRFRSRRAVRCCTWA